MTQPAVRPHGRRPRVLASVAAVLLVALVSGVLAATWYRTIEEGEQRADERGYEQITLLLLRRIDREGDERAPVIIEDFDDAVSAHIAIAQQGDVLLSAGAPGEIRTAVLAFRESEVLRVRRRTARIGGESYELFGGATPRGTRAYVVREETRPAQASTFRPVLVVGWAAAVAFAAIAAFAMGRRREAGLRRSYERERNLTSAIAHDLRTPLTSVLTAAALVEAHADRLPEEVRRPAAVLSEELERLRILVEDLLELARLEAGDHAMHVEVVTVADVVRDVLEARSWTERVRTDLDGQAAAAVDRLSISRIVLNLVDNALCHGGGDVVVRVHRRRRSTVIDVSDGGTTADPAMLRRTLEGRASDRDPGRGGGLGLRIAQQNASLHGTRIEVVADPDRGTTFRLRLRAVAPVRRESSVS